MKTAMTWHAAAEHANDWVLQRRGFDLGAIRPNHESLAMPDDAAVVQHWQHDDAVLLPQLFADALTQQHAAIEHSEQWVGDILQGDMPSDCLPDGDWNNDFSLVGSSDEAHDEQAIEKIFFADLQQQNDDWEDNLWCKASWLSFHDDDASLRFRFSFGMEGFEDVAADPAHQQAAAALCSALFPESAIVTDHPRIHALMQQVIGSEVSYVERIVYFNAPDGGAQMHHDVERGHAGVIYAQLSGATFWLAAAKPVLMDEIRAYAKNQPHLAQSLFDDVAAQQQFNALLHDEAALDAYLDQDDHELLEVLMDQHPDFIGHMVAQGYGYIVRAGDALLLPQRDLQHCVWHTVFCLGEEMGEALSFAMRQRV
jgi:hypothetical protein